MRALTSAGSRHTSCPATSTVPSSGLSRPVIIERVVVLPAPFGPTRPTNLPAGRSRSIPATAVCCPNRFHRPRTRTAGTAASAVTAPEAAVAAASSRARARSASLVMSSPLRPRRRSPAPTTFTLRADGETGPSLWTTSVRPADGTRPACGQVRKTPGRSGSRRGGPNARIDVAFEVVQVTTSDARARQGPSVLGTGTAGRCSRPTRATASGSSGRVTRSLPSGGTTHGRGGGRGLVHADQVRTAAAGRAGRGLGRTEWRRAPGQGPDRGGVGRRGPVGGEPDDAVP
ncbi:hypothetical protein SDIAM103S_03472 [Streptomyces diastaticus subsp. diastaticus]